MATTETTKQVDDPDIEAIIETIVQERPWRGPIYAVTYFFRRWMVTLFTLTSAIGNGYSINLVVALGLLAFLIDIYVVPRHAVELRNGGREYIERICKQDIIIEEMPRELTNRINLYIKYLIILFAICLVVIWTPFVHENLPCGEFCEIGSYYLFILNISNYFIFICTAVMTFIASISWKIDGYPNWYGIERSSIWFRQANINKNIIEKLHVGAYDGGVAASVRPLAFIIILSICYMVLLLHISSTFESCFIESILVLKNTGMLLLLFLLQFCSILSLLYKAKDIAKLFLKQTAGRDGV